MPQTTPLESLEGTPRGESRPKEGTSPAGHRVGERLDAAVTLTLLRDAPFLEVAAMAHEARCRHNDPARVTYLADRNVNYTNVCVTDCQFCGFYRRPGDESAYVLDRDVLGRKIEETLAAGGSRILMQGGHHPDLRLAWYVSLLRWIKATFPAIGVNAFSPSEVDHVASLEGKTTLDVLRDLQEAGLDGLPGGGAEILDDEVRRRISPKKLEAAGWLRIMGEAQSLGLTTTCSMVIGFGESLEQRVRHLERLRERQDRSLAEHGRGFTAFIAWTAQLDDVGLGPALRRHGHLEPTPHEYLRILSVARLFLDNVPHVQASWPTMGPKIAQVALHHGADDFGSTMMEENVVSQGSSKTHRSLTAAEIRRQIRDAGYVPAERDADYHILRVFEEPTPEELPGALPTYEEAAKRWAKRGLGSVAKPGSGC